MDSPFAWSGVFPAEGPPSPGADGPPLPPDHGLHTAAGEPEVRLLEERLGLPLPPSYRAFLLYADGYGDADEDDYCLFRTERVGWLRDLEPEWCQIWGPQEGDKVPSVPDDLYFVYGRGQNGFVRNEYVPHTLLIGCWDGLLLLNPLVVTPDGEWEAWHLASWRAGAARGRSFWELMASDLV
ncbi:SMI1/KNR4 family protein [Herbidospora sp. NBRC 101105]|uniref:SMI1/KNR4 family protein n=1 Tax=Herbidospora sp. NBRC 101105 TaxID=3032195 RepID=UPI0024A2F049|nr:SMI1/KNR4 family protein [Herbidospora sp. NBRC 101105]GLX92714.1 hypothetical protein Hesp01_06640 [Herbidospora sp. NBRC 101105]